MALAKGVNSFATVAEADAILEDRLDVAAWTEASEDQKSQALVTATTLLDLQSWIGYIENMSQRLSFPRVGEYFDPRLNRVVPMNPVPDRIVRATVELAYHLLNNDGLLDDTGGVMNLEIAGIKLEKIRSTQKLPYIVRELVKCLKVGGGSREVWRAN